MNNASHLLQNGALQIWCVVLVFECHVSEIVLQEKIMCVSSLKNCNVLLCP